MATIFLSAKLAEFNLNLSFYLWIERGKHPFFFFFSSSQLVFQL